MVRYASWIIPGVIVSAFVVVAWISAMDLLGPFRIGYYGLGAIGVLLGLRGLIRQLRSLHVEGPPLLLVALISQKFSLTAIMAGLFLAGANDLIPALPDVPDWVILGLLGSSCVSFFVVGVVLDFAGRHHMMSAESVPGPFRVLMSNRKEGDD